MTTPNMPANQPEPGTGYMPSGEEMSKQVAGRVQRGKYYSYGLISALAIGFLLLIILFLSIINDAFGPVAIEANRSPAEVAELTGGREVEELSSEELVTLVEQETTASNQRILKRELGVPIDQPLDPAALDQGEWAEIVNEFVLEEQIVQSWKLFDGLFNWDGVVAEAAESNPNATVQWYSWLNWDFLTSTMSSDPTITGIRTAILGTLWLISVTIIVAVPLGVGAAIYLEEYATTTTNPTLQRINEFIQTNINNLAGVPSIIYGILGLAVFVRALEPITSGSGLGLTDATTANGRTVLSGGMTLALLILPVIIISAQEAIRAVPSSLRQASFGLGATRWQTVWNHVLPSALPGVITGVILAVSRAIGETAPLIVVGAATFITTDPTGPFSKFTVLPIQIYNWAAQPEPEFRNASGAAIVVLLVILLTMNAVATTIRSHYSKFR